MGFLDDVRNAPLPVFQPVILNIILLFTLPAIACIVTWLYTTVRYRLELRKHMSPGAKPETPPHVPYTLPFLGHSMSFLAPYPGLFWTRLFKRHPRSTGSCTLALAGRTAHILFDPTAVQALFKAREPTRDQFNYQTVEKFLGISAFETRVWYDLEPPMGEEKDRDPRFASHLQYEYMLRQDRVNELTDTFIRKLAEELRGHEKMSDGKDLVTNLSAWLTDRMFTASTYTLLGAKVLEVYPELVQDFWPMDRAMLTLLFGLPKVLVKEHVAARDKVVAGMMRWQEAAFKACNGEPTDPDAVEWEPIYGSRLTRARQRVYKYKGLDTHFRAAMDTGMLFAISSNAIPATCWILLHILNPQGDKTLLPRVLEELEKAKTSDGGIDVPTLIARPLLNSIMTEVLRLYVDALVTRDCPVDITLPMEEGKRQIKIRKGDLVIAPSWLGQRDTELWNEPPADVFYAERFLKHDPESGKDTFTMAGTAGKYFPFGGGKTICPGRVFAKQEVLGAVAMVLLNYDIEPLNFVDGKGKETNKFPGLAKQYAGNAVMTKDGDLKVRIKRRS